MNEVQTILRKFLRRLTVRSPLTVAEQQRILGLTGEICQLPARRDFVRSGGNRNFACLVADGLAARFVQTSSGRRQITALNIPGDMCDLQSLAVPVAGWGIEALAPTRFLLVPHSALRRIVADHPAIGIAFWRDTIVDGSVTAKWLSGLGRRSAEARLAHLLCEMGCRFEQAGDGRRDDFRMQTTQVQLADILGISAVHVNRSLQSLRARGLMTLENFRCRVIDMIGLVKLAEFNRDYLLCDKPAATTGDGALIPRDGRPMELTGHAEGTVACVRI